MRLLPLLLLSAACELPPPTEPAPVEVTQAATPVNEGTLPEPDATRAQICADDGLLLTRYDFHTIKHRFDELCCAEDGVPGDPRCGKPWPFPENPRCIEWENLRYRVAARYGYVWDADDPAHKKFTAEPWYRENPGFQLGDMSIVAKRNDSTLRRFYLDKHECK